MLNLQTTDRGRSISAILLLLLILFIPGICRAATFTVEVRDHQYIPANITISEGDTVRWTWFDDNHNVVSGAPMAPDGAFESELRNRGYQFEHTFNREFVNANPRAANRYNYYCFPHSSMGMVGSVTVVRSDKLFSAGLHPWEAIGNGGIAPASNASGSCNVELSAEEDQLSITCNHTLGQFAQAQLHRGYFGASGALICSLSGGSGTPSTCPVGPADVAELFSGGVYIEYSTVQFPAGELRGQVVKVGGSNVISGRIELADHTPIAGVTVDDGVRSAVTDSAGEYRITGVPNGTYRLRGVKGSRAIVPDVATSPLMVMDGDSGNRDFTAYPSGSCGVDTDGDGVCDIDEIADGSNPMDAGSYRSRLNSPVYVIWNGFLKVTNIIEVSNKSSQSASVHLTLYDISGVDRHQFDIPLGPLGQYDVIVNDIPGFTADSYGIVKLEFDAAFNNQIDGRTFYYRPNSAGTFDFAYSIPFTKPLVGRSSVGFNTFQPSGNPGEGTNLVAQWLSIVNLEPDEFKVFTVNKYGQGGELIGSAMVSVPPLGRTDMDGGHIVPGPSRVGLDTIIPQDPTAPYQAVLIRYGGNAPPGRTADRYSFAFPLLARAGDGEIQRVPISTGGGAQNWLELINPTSGTVNIAIKAYGNNGQELLSTAVGLGAYQQQHLNIGSLLASGESGSAELQPSVPGSLIGQSMFYFRQGRGEIASMYGSSIRESYGTVLYGNYNLFLGMYNWLKLTNTLGTESSVAMTLYRGSQQISSHTILLPPHGGIDLGLHEGSVFGTIPDSYGVVRIEGDTAGAIGSELLRLRTDPAGGIDYAAPTSLR